MYKHATIALITLASCCTGVFAASQDAPAGDYAFPKFSWLMTGALSPRDAAAAGAADVVAMHGPGPIVDAINPSDKRTPAALAADVAVAQTAAAPSADVADLAKPGEIQRAQAKPKSAGSPAVVAQLLRTGGDSSVSVLTPISRELDRQMRFFESPFELDGRISGHETQIMQILLPAGFNFVSITAGSMSTLTLEVRDAGGNVVLDGISGGNTWLGHLMLDHPQVFTFEVVNHGRYGNWYNLWTR